MRRATVSPNRSSRPSTGVFASAPSALRRTKAPGPSKTKRRRPCRIAPAVCASTLPYGRTPMRTLFIAIAVAAAAIQSTACHAQAYPSRPVRFIVGFTPGGGVAINARLLAARMSEYLGQQVVVEKNPGPGPNIANEYVAKSTADGYTL